MWQVHVFAMLQDIVETLRACKITRVSLYFSIDYALLFLHAKCFSVPKGCSCSSWRSWYGAWLLGHLTIAVSVWWLASAGFWDVWPYEGGHWPIRWSLRCFSWMSHALFSWSIFGQIVSTSSCDFATARQCCKVIYYDLFIFIWLVHENQWQSIRIVKLTISMFCSSAPQTLRVFCSMLVHQSSAGFGTLCAPLVGHSNKRAFTGSGWRSSSAPLQASSVQFGLQSFAARKAKARPDQFR